MPGGGLLGGPAPAVRRLLLQGGRVANPAPRSPEKVPADRRVQVLAIVHGWFPALAAGSERMMQHLLDALPRDEFDVEVLSFGVGEPDSTIEKNYVYQGLPVTRGLDPPVVPDIVILHHGFAARLVHSYTEQFPNAYVVVVHHNDRFDIEDLLGVNADLNVFNTKWVKESLKTPGIVVRPPLEYERHHVEETGESVTLVNLQENKGVDLFYDLVNRMPDQPFLGVLGTHGEQKVPHALGLYSQLQIHPVTQDMREVWSQTKVVLMPSEYESYGMVAAEACASGIPVIANPTPGLVECLGDSGIFIPRDDTDGYEQALRELLSDRERYVEESARSAKRGRELVHQSEIELRKFVTAIRKLVR